MRPVTCITNFRRARRNQYLAEHGKRIDSFIRNFIRFNVDYDFQYIANAYVRSRAGDNQVSWDYLDLREELRDVIARELADVIYNELCKTKWFDQRVLDLEQIADRCFSLFILEDWAAIS